MCIALVIICLLFVIFGHGEQCILYQHKSTIYAHVYGHIVNRQMSNNKYQKVHFTSGVDP